MVPAHHDVIIVGGGIMGGGIAEQLRRYSDLRVCMIEQEPAVHQGTSASRAAAGGVNPHLDDVGEDALRPMAQRSRELYPAWVERLAAAWDEPIRLRRSGLLRLAVEEKEHTRLVTDVLPLLRRWGVDAREVGARDARHREPLLGPAVVGGIWLPDDLVVEPLRVLAALEAVLGAGDRFTRVPGRVEAISTDGGGVRVTLRSGDGDAGSTVLTSDRVVVAAGHRSPPLLKDLADWREDGFTPVKGQILEVAAPTGYSLRTQCDALVPDKGESHAVVAAPYADGRVTLGVTQDRGDTSPSTTPTARAAILRNLRRILPAVADWKVIGARAGVRPGTADGLPVIGYVDPDRRVLAATGHNGLGITLAPRTAELAVKLLLGLTLDEADHDDLRTSGPERLITRSRPAQPATVGGGC